MEFLKFRHDMSGESGGPYDYFLHQLQPSSEKPVQAGSKARSGRMQGLGDGSKPRRKTKPTI
jgi:hypothetical protein